MILKGAAEARVFGKQIASQISAGNISAAHQESSAYLNDKNPFRLLDLIGSGLADCPPNYLYSFLDWIADDGSEGGWVMIASSLFSRKDAGISDTLNRCRVYIIQADIWYAADIFGERVPGPLLLTDFEQTIIMLSPWRCDSNFWIRRVVGVAVHFWAKRTKGGDSHLNHADELLTFLVPLFEEKNISAAKGIGWGLKTLGRYYPEHTAKWLHQQLILGQKKPIAVVKRKALNFLPADLREALISSQDDPKN